MRFFHNVLIPLIAILFSTTNAIPTTPSSLLKYEKIFETRGTRATARTDLLSIGDPRDISIRDLSTPTKILAHTLKLLYNNLTISIPSTTTATVSQFATFYTQINAIILKNIASAPSHYFTFTLGAYRMVIHCASEAIPWSLLNDIVQDMREWVRDKWAPVEASFRFLGVNPYFVAAPAVIVVSISVLAPFVRDLLRGGG